ncbi:hypothetical protein Q3C30_09880, partial [Enterococcus faecium]|nr:hypothetical protein [Enterococcus faecium]
LWLKTLYRKRAVTWPFIFYTIIWTLSETLSYNQTFAESFWFNGCVLVAFAAVFSMIQFILGKERNYRWQPNWAKN